MIQIASTQKLISFFEDFKLLQYKRRAMILHSNDTPSTASVFFIKSGYIRVYRISEEGEELTLTILKEQDFFPLTYGFGVNPNNYYLEAITPLEIWKAPQEQFLNFVRNDPEVFYELTNRLLVRFDGVLARMESMVFSNAYTKVASILLMCAQGLGEPDGQQIVVKVPLTHKDIATMIGITRETTSLEMKKLERKGIIKRKGKFLIISDVEQLKKEAIQKGNQDLITLSVSL